MIKKQWPVLLILFFSLLVVSNLTTVGFPDTHDGHNHLARLANLWLTIKSGQIPPRFAPNLDHGFGYPVFNFNYYFPFLLALVYKILPFFNFESSLKAALVTYYFLGGFGIYQWLKPKTNKFLSTIAALIYLSAPFQLVNIFVRGNAGEVAIIGILPWVLWIIDRLKPPLVDKKFLLAAMFIAFYWLNHNLVTITGLPFIICYYLLTHFKKLTNQFFKFSIFLFILSGSLVAFFYLPAFMEKKFTVLDNIINQQNFFDHFLFWRQLIDDSHWGYGYSQAGINDGMSFSLGMRQIIICAFNFILISILILRRRLNWRKVKPYLFFCLSLCFIVLMTLPLSQPVYHSVKFLQYLQFPWRWLTLAPICISFLSVWGLSQLKTKKISLTILLIICGLVIFPSSNHTQASNYFHNSDDFYYHLYITSSTLHENTFDGFNRDKANLLRQPYVLERNNHSQEVIQRWDAKQHLYVINSSSPMDIVEHTAYFPGWQVQANGNTVSINFTDEEFPGLINYRLPPGQYQIKTVFTQKTPARIIGNTLSCCGLIIIIILWVNKKTLLCL